MSQTNNISTDARTKLLNAAEILFAENGYELTSIRDISGAAGLNLSLINYYFGSKQGLYREIFQLRFAEINLSLQNIIRRPLSAVEKLIEFLMIYVDKYRLNRDFQLILYRELFFLSKSIFRDMIESYLSAHTKVFRAIMAEGIAKGYFKPLHPAFFQMTLISVVYTVICETPVAGKMPGQSFSVDEIKTYLYQILLTNNSQVNGMN
jgi:AcrR family transcriptional regulator